MPKKISKQDEKFVIEWLKGEITMAEMARQLKMNHRTMLPYVRVAKTIKKLYSDRTIVLLKQ